MHFSKNDVSKVLPLRNQYMRSTRDLKFESYVMAKNAIPTITVDGDATKVLQSGTVLAKITTGGDAGKVGVFMAGVADGRQTAANIVGVVDTFLPWELLERDAPVAVCYEGAVVQGWCFEYNAGGTPVALTNTTRDAILALPNVALLFK